ncbi:MAG: beta-ketoacyl-ACP synthase II [candidate division FCPU426 bacterium]
MRRDPYATRVVITGLGTVNPLGHTIGEFWENLTAGRSGIRLARHTDLDGFPVRIGGEVDLPDLAPYFLHPKMIRRLDRFIVFSQIAGAQALRDSGLEVARAPRRFGAVIGTGDAGVGVQFANVSTVLQKGMESVSPFYVVGTIPNTAAGYLATEYGLQGPNFTVNSACASSNHALGLAAMMIKLGEADAMLAGGAEAVVNTMGFAGFGVIRALSERNDSPETASRPFDKDRDGFVLGEGAGVLCLEELEHARRRGARIYGELSGWGFTCDAHDLVAPHPEGRGAVEAMNLALESARLEPGDIDLINAHGTSTPLGDLSESRAIGKVFREHTPDIPVHSTKSMIGHLVGAGGGVEAIAGLLAVDKGIIHPTINQFEQDPEIHLHVVRNQAREAEVGHFLSNSFGFGGQNASVVISKFKG